MELGALQKAVRESALTLETPYRSGTEVVLRMTEELGEVATEVALLERVGSKAAWRKERDMAAEGEGIDPDVARLAEEITHLLNNTFALANHFGIDLSDVYKNKNG